LHQSLAEQGTTLYTPIKKPKGQELTKMEKYYNRLVSRLRQPFESFFLRRLREALGYSEITNLIAFIALRVA
jgi:hypothetical protein